MKPDRHILYEAAVQGVEYDLDFFERVWRTLRGGRFTRLREDFCGTAAIACGWASRRPANRAWGVDLDSEVLDWARRHRLPRLRGVARRVELVRGDVRKVWTPAADVVVAFNFSYWVFHHRPQLVEYFRAVRRSLSRRGLFIVNAFGGTEAMRRIVEPRRIAASTSVDGERVPPFKYIWDQARFNPVDHRLLCYIHFELKNGVRMRRAFTYDWRLWTLPEIEEAMLDAGFRSVEFWVEGWDAKKNRSDDIYHRRRKFENQESWLACIVGVA